VKSTSEVSAEPTTTQAPEWCTPPSELSLPAHAVHVWRADLGLEAAYLRRLGQNLSADERERASRFRFTRDRVRFIGARGLLREILALYLNASPGRLSFDYGAHGKPFLAGEHSNLRFNVSHSFDAMLLAIAHMREVGVDVEGMGNIGLAMDELGDTVLSEPEKQALTRFRGEDRRTTFLRFWTLKEAFIKADGRGVSLPLKRIDVSAREGRVAVLNEATGEWRTCSRWELRTLAPVPGYVAALAAEGQDWRLALWHWSRESSNDPVRRRQSTWHSEGGRSL
jgi:4'-phosphopantetheinyl transferase